MPWDIRDLYRRLTPDEGHHFALLPLLAVFRWVWVFYNQLQKDQAFARAADVADGQARTLQVAVHYADLCGYDEVVIGVGDQPLVPPEAWRRVAAETATPIAVASFDGVTTPPVRLHRDVWRLLPVDGDEGARQLLRSRPELVTEVPCPGSGIDVDTAGELAQIRRNRLVKELGSWT